VKMKLKNLNIMNEHYFVTNAVINNVKKSGIEYMITLMKNEK
jgi:hypothetical protein